MSFHYEIFCNTNYKRRIEVRCLVQLPLCLVGDVELNPGPLMVCAIRANVRTNGSVL